MGYVVGIDTGGTFTDVVVCSEDGAISTAKARTTPADLSVGLEHGLRAAAAELDLGFEEFLSQVSVMRLSGTTATNALLTRSGVPTGLITTRGFEDTLSIGRAVSAWAGATESELRRSYRQRKPEPLVPRDLIAGVSERVDWSGEVVVPLDEEEVAAALAQLEAAGVESIAICFLWSIRNPEHEQRAAEIVRDRCPGVSVHCSHQVAPAVGEYERFITTAVDAYVSPTLTAFLGGIEETLGGHGFSGELLVAQADGGVLYPRDAQPVFTLHSGPAAGVIASRDEGQRTGHANVVATDVGGTSFDVGLVAEGEWLYAREPELGGHHLSVPMIEIASIGAGGGSVAWVDETGILHVGPESAGAVPGPACYGQGGTEATVTDADLLLGYLDPEAFLGGTVRLDRDAAERAIAAVAERVSLDLIETAAGIFQIANSRMGDLLTRQVVSRGHDPRDFAILAYGGAGPMHCAFYAAESGAKEVIVPAIAGTFSALGVATAPIRHSARAHTFAALPIDLEEFNSTFERLDRGVVEALERDGVGPEQREVVYVLEARYGAQVHTLRLPIPRRRYDGEAMAALDELFDATYERVYGSGAGYPDAGRFVTAMIVEGYGNLRRDAGTPEVAGGSAEEALRGSRQVYFDGAPETTEVYAAAALGAGAEVAGPAIIEAAETTVVVPPGCTARADERRSLHLTGFDLGGRERSAAGSGERLGARV